MSDMEFYEMSKQRQMGHSDMGAQGGGNEVRDVICLSVIFRRERPLGVAEGLHGVIALAAPQRRIDLLEQTNGRRRTLNTASRLEPHTHTNRG